MKTESTRRLCVLPILFALTAGIVVPARTARAAIENEPLVQAEKTGQILRTYRTAPDETAAKRADSEQPPEWVEAAFREALDSFRATPGSEGLEDPDRELVLAGADEDDLGQTHVRMQQVHDGVEVVGGELVANLDGGAIQDVGGRIFEEAAVPGAGDTAESVAYPDHYADYWKDPDNCDNGGVHVNGSIMNHAFSLLATGGTHRLGITVPGIGRSKAEKIFDLARTTRLTKTATFPDVCQAAAGTGCATPVGSWLG